jgi:hypothetical protein
MATMARVMLVDDYDRFFRRKLGETVVANIPLG